nr:movement protein [Callicarpa mosaic-associated virus 1]
MKFFEFYFKLFMFSMFSMALQSETGQALDIEDTLVVDHDVSKWADPSNRNIELSEAIINGLAATTIKKQIDIEPKTKVVEFEFYKWITAFLKTIKGLTKVRLASILVHYKPHTDSCKGTVSYALVDQRFQNDKLSAEKRTKKDKDKSEVLYSVIGRVKHLVTLKCDETAVIQMSMNHFVTVPDLKSIKLIQIVSGIDMTSGTLATLGIGWKTIPGDATVYQHYPAQRYTFPREKLPELEGQSTEVIFQRLVKMAKNRHDKEVQMLNQLQELVDNQNVINNDLEVDITNEISDIQNQLKKHQDDVEKIEKAIPNQQKLNELKQQLEAVKKIKAARLQELKNPINSNDEVVKLHRHDKDDDSKSSKTVDFED